MAEANGAGSHNHTNQKAPPSYIEATSLLSDAPREVEEYVKGAPLFLKYRSSKAFILVTICLALFTDSFIYGVLVPVLPFMLKDRCGVPEEEEQIWTSALFAVFGAAILIGSPLCGWYADKSSSRRLPLLLSLPVLAAATGLLGASKEVGVLLLSRALQGFSTAVVWTVGLALTRDTVRKEDVGQSMGTAISSSSIGLVISPMLGGAVYAKAGLWGVLGMMIALVVLNVVLVILMIEKRVATKYIKQKPHRSPESTHASYGTISEQPPDPRAQDIIDSTAWQGTETLVWPNNAIEALSSRQPSVIPISRVPPGLRLLRSARILTAAYGVFTQFGLLASFDAFLPLFVKRRFAWGSLQAGLVFLNLAIPALAGPLAGKLSDRFGPRRVALGGCILTAPPLVLLRLVGYDTTDQVILLCFLLTVIGTFLTLIISPLAADLSFAVDQIEADNPGLFGKKGAYAQAYAQAYALFNCAMAGACVAGPLIAGGVQDRFGAENVACVLGLWCASAAVPVLFFTGDDREPRRTADSEGLL